MKFLLLTALLLTGNSFAATDYQVGKYDVDAAHTRVSFIVPQLGLDVAATRGIIF